MLIHFRTKGALTMNNWEDEWVTVDIICHRLVVNSQPAEINDYHVGDRIEKKIKLFVKSHRRKSWGVWGGQDPPILENKLFSSPVFCCKPNYQCWQYECSSFICYLTRCLIFTTTFGVLFKSLLRKCDASCPIRRWYQVFARADWHFQMSSKDWLITTHMCFMYPCRVPLLSADT